MPPFRAMSAFARICPHLSASRKAPKRAAWLPRQSSPRPRQLEYAASMSVAELDWFHLPLWLQISMGIGLALLVLVVVALVAAFEWLRVGRTRTSGEQQRGSDPSGHS